MRRPSRESAIERRTCPVCVGAELRDLDALGHRRLAGCRRCGHRFVARCDDALLEAEYRAAYYDGAEDPRIAAWAAAHQRVWDAVLEQILAIAPRATSLLDVGAGSGGFLLRVRTRSPALQLAAVEPAAAARAALRQRLPDVTFPAETADRLGDVAARFDVVTMLQTLEHLRDPLAACRGAWTCLRPGGLFLVAVPNRRSFAVWRRGRAADCYANGTHLQFFAAREVRRLLRSAGFAHVRRLIAFGGGQHAAWLPSLAQYAARVAGFATEVRFVAQRV